MRWNRSQLLERLRIWCAQAWSSGCLCHIATATNEATVGLLGIKGTLRSRWNLQLWPWKPLYLWRVVAVRNHVYARILEPWQRLSRTSALHEQIQHFGKKLYLISGQFDGLKGAKCKMISLNLNGRMFLQTDLEVFIMWWFWFIWRSPSSCTFCL